MKQLRRAEARERRAPVFWWFALALAMGVALVWLAHGRMPHGGALLAVLLAGAWAAPLAAFASLAAPRRARGPAPAPGEGTYDQWMGQARLIGRMLLYWDDGADLPKSLRETLRAAREDLRDTLGAHPLRDDLERVCGRIREGAIQDLKRYFWREYRSRVRELREKYELYLAVGMGDDERLAALKTAVENAAAVMIRRCMPRMLERERLECALECAWLAAQGAAEKPGLHSPIDLAGALVVEWCDFSEPWLPARMLERARARLDRTVGMERAPIPAGLVGTVPDPAVPLGAPAAAADERAEYPEALDPHPEAMPWPPGPPPAAPKIETAPADGDGHRPQRVRVRVRRSHRRHSRHYRGPSLADIVLSFAQWVRYSVRSWILYR